MNSNTLRQSLRLSATLLLLGQILYIVITLFHTGGEANNHPAIFAAYAASGAWVVDHIGQFAAMAVMLAGLLALSGPGEVSAHGYRLGDVAIGHIWAPPTSEDGAPVYHAAFLQRLHPPPAWGLRKADFLGKIGHGYGCVVLKRAQYASIEFVHIDSQKW